MAYILLPEQNSTKLHSIDRLHGGHRDYPIWLIVCCWTNHSTECRCFQGCRKRGSDTLPNDGVAQVMAASDGDKNIGLAKMLETEWQRQRQRTSVTRLGDLLHFGQLFKTCGNNYFAQIAHIFGIFWKGQNLSFFLWNHFGQLLKTFGDFLMVTLQRMLTIGHVSFANGFFSQFVRRIGNIKT